ncbi:kinase-like domain-containing protein [Scheffersomyces xylosifermentans]|uniref:kinase-like domain-containing protein n=1 Tax=Scheffersomyces xylosifermentans TaxID=1304137 RepID=UPI00315CEF3A
MYKRTEVIGRGKFGIVYKGYNKQTKQVVAIKVLNLDTEEDEVTDVQEEIKFLTECRNIPNVTQYYGSFLNDTKLWIIMDYCAGGSLRTLLKSGVFEEKYIGVIVRELLIALSSVHRLGVIHRDLKAANVLITKEGKVQLCDFGVAAKITSSAFKRTTIAGTPYWMAPEVIREGDTYNSKADIWSLGITIYEIATGNPPYCDKDAKWAMQLISKSTPPRLEGREYSPILKECIALCLDENPDERPSADDLLKCKLVRIYKNHPRIILKEVISRYLVWRDHNSSRDSVFISLEDEQNTDSKEDDRGSNGDNTNQIQVKWDFDSLSSKEYIIEDNLEYETVDESFPMYNDDVHGDTYQTLPTLQASSMGARNNATFQHRNQSVTGTLNNSSSRSNNSEIPKSLQSLFEDTDEGIQEDRTLPMLPNPSVISSFNEQRMDSPTIEIPDMDNLGNFNTSSIASANPHPPLNKPPTLYHSQSASGNLETRFSSQNQSASSRPRKKTISNTISNTLSNTISTSHSNGIMNKTPSPKPPPTAVLLSSAGLATSINSPSKSMKALQSTSNPLLQPINFKLTGEPNNGNSDSNQSNNTLANVRPSQPMSQSQSSVSTMGSIPSNASTGMTTTSTASLKAKRARPGLHIQMPTPSNTVNQLSALTSDAFSHPDGDNINQFGINPAQAAPLTMTPVTEKEPPTFAHAPSLPTQEGENDDSGHHQRHVSRDRADVPTSGNPIASSVSNLTNTSGANLFLPRTNSITNFTSNNSQQLGAPASAVQSTKFPTIPQISGEFFMDSSNKQKLITELDSMIKLFTQGLEALEDHL